MISEEQKDELRAMGRDHGCLAVPIVGARTLDQATLTEDEWDANWAVWKVPGNERGRFVVNRDHPGHKEGNR